MQFYSALLDQPGVRVSGGRHYFSCGDVTLALYSPKGDGDKRDPHPNFDHICYSPSGVPTRSIAGRSNWADCRPGAATASCRWERSPPGRGANGPSIRRIRLATRSASSTRARCSPGSHGDVRAGAASVAALRRLFRVGQIHRHDDDRTLDVHELMGHAGGHDQEVALAELLGRAAFDRLAPRGWCRFAFRRRACRR